MCDELVEINSKNIKSVGYEMTIKVVCVKYVNGSLHIYQGVPINEFNELSKASCAEKYLSQNIEGRYPHKQVV